MGDANPASIAEGDSRTRETMEMLLVELNIQNANIKKLTKRADLSSATKREQSTQIKALTERAEAADRRADAADRRADAATIRADLNSASKKTRYTN